MLPRYTNEVLTRLERVAQIGCAEVSKHEILWWYNQERVTVGIWRDIQQKWQEEILRERLNFDPDEAPLLIGYDDEGTYVLVWGEGLSTDDTWLKDARTLARA